MRKSEDGFPASDCPKSCFYGHEMCICVIFQSRNGINAVKPAKMPKKFAETVDKPKFMCYI